MPIELITNLPTTTARNWWDDNPWRLSAALSYYTLFSLAPLLTLAVAGAAMVVDETAVEEELLRQLQELIGGKGANALTPMLHSAGHPVHGSLATLISLSTLFIVSMGMFSELQDALNFIWRIPGHGRSSALWGLFRTRLFSFCWSSAGRAYCLAGCLDWSKWHCRPVYIGKVGTRAVSGRAGTDHNVRNRSSLMAILVWVWCGSIAPR